MMNSLPISSLVSLFSVVLITQVASCDGRLILPQLGARGWKLHDSSLKTRLGPLHAALSADAITPSEAAEEFSSSVSDFLNGVDGGGEGRGGWGEWRFS